MHPARDDWQDLGGSSASSVLRAFASGRVTDSRLDRAWAHTAREIGTDDPVQGRLRTRRMAFTFWGHLPGREIEDVAHCLIEEASNRI